MSHRRRVAVIVSAVALVGLGCGGLATAHSHHHGYHHSDHRDNTMMGSGVGTGMGMFGSMFNNMNAPGN
jgi:hypothetical protein